MKRDAMVVRQRLAAALAQARLRWAGALLGMPTPSAALPRSAIAAGQDAVIIGPRP